MNNFVKIATDFAGENITNLSDTNLKLWSGLFSVSVLLYRTNNFAEVVKLPDDVYSVEVLIRHGKGDDMFEVVVGPYCAAEHWNSAQFSALMLMLPSLATQTLAEAVPAMATVFELGKD